jgi:hypothetical protein
MPSSLSAATSPARSPSRTSTVRIAQSRRPVAVRRSRPANRSTALIDGQRVGFEVEPEPAESHSPTSADRDKSVAAKRGAGSGVGFVSGLVELRHFADRGFARCNGRATRSCHG